MKPIDINYKSILLKIYTDYDGILKDLFATLFLDIHKSIEQKVITLDKPYIENLKGFPDQLDLNKTLQRFWFNHYQLDEISREKGNFHFAFSLGDVTSILRRSPFYKKQDLVIKIKKKFEMKYSLSVIDQFAWIAREVTRWRNIAFHSDGISNSAQSSILWSNLSLLLKIYPDDLRSVIRNLEKFEQLINEDFLESILVNTKFEHEVQNEKNLDDEMLEFLEAEQDISGKHETVSEIDIESMKEMQAPVMDEFKKVSANLDDLNKSIKLISESNLELKKELILVKEKISSSSSTNKDDFTEQPHILEEEPKDSKQIENVIYQDSKRKRTNAEIKDDLLRLRNKIRDHMRSKFPLFQNWHNILMEPMINQILLWDIKTVKDLRNDELFQSYYNFRKFPGKNMTKKEIMIQKNISKELMDYQIKEFWSEIKKSL